MNRIRELRLQNGWRQEALAVLMNTKQQTIARYETGQLGIDASIICRLCDIFGCTSDYLLCRSAFPSPALSEDEAELLIAYRAADVNIKTGILALLEPYKKEQATNAV